MTRMAASIVSSMVIRRFGAGVAIAFVVSAVLMIPSSRVSARRAPYDPRLFAGLQWRLLGPFRGGRVDAVSGVPGRPNEFYFGSVNGGVWKTIDAGRVWAPVFDSQPVASIGALAVAPSSPDVVYVGSGESTLRDSTGYGNGVYKSTDAGRTWRHIGLDDTQHIGKVAVDPKNANIVFVAAIGHLYDAHPERGLYRSLDGGGTWRKVLFKNDSVGAVDVVIDPTNSQVVYASLWNTRRPTWYTYQPTNGPGGGLYKSTDGGSTWTQLTSGLPAACIGRSGIAVAPSNPRRVYAIVDNFLPEGQTSEPATGCPGTPPGRGGRGVAPTAPGTPGAPVAPAAPQGGLYRSDDAGATWTKMSTDAASISGLSGRGWYFEKVAVDPKNADIVYVPNVATYRSMDGGRTWVTLRGSPGGDDYHQAWISPDDSNTMILASDQGAIITHNAKADPQNVTWSSWLNQPTAQIYHVSTDYRVPYWVTGAQQDSGAVAVRSRGKFAGISMRDWEPIGPGGESGMTAGDRLHPGIVFGFLSRAERWNLELNGTTGNVTQPQSPEPARTDWTQPLVFSKADPHILYYANQFLFKTTNEGQTWTQMSPDLTRPDPGIPANLDAVAAKDTDRNGNRGVIYAVAPSPVRTSLVWIGTDDGLIQITTDDGVTWQNVTPPAVTSWSRVTTIEASHTDANAAYASVDRHQLTDFNPHIYRTRDLGRTWQEITRGLPAGVYVHVVKEDPLRKGLLFAGTERNVYVSFDDGDNWQSLQLNLPVTSMRDFEVHDNDLILATHGRGFWVIDDIAPLRQITDAVAASDAHLFKPSDAVVYIQGGDNGTPTQRDEPQVPNPPDGAVIYYYLKTAATAPVTLEVLDSSGTVLRTMSTQPGGAGGAAAAAPGRPGGAGGAAQSFPPNTTILWRPTPEPFLGTAGMHRVVLAPGAGGGRGAGRGGGGPASGVGTFTLRLTVNGVAYSQPLVVKPDPRAR
jgi:photosystem II stability/assembly factor-like uncharacterized protein